MADQQKGSKPGLGVISLTALVVSAMIGGGVYNLPQNMAQYSSAFAVIVAWIITGVGMFFIANTFVILSNVRPDATTGIYEYSRLGFGKFAGFQMAWGYWLCNVFANVGYAVLLMDSLNYFFPPYFKGGNNLLSVIGGSLIIWLMYFLVLNGVKSATSLNNIGTVCKLVPLFVFVVVCAWMFSSEKFFTDFYGHEVIKSLANKDLGSMTAQVKSTMLVTLWVFIGIEGAVVVSDRARNQTDVAKATLIGFFVCLLFYAALSLLAFGIMSQGQLSTLEPPSTAPVLAAAAGGTWGIWLMNLGVIIALLSSWLVWTILLAWLPFAAAKDGTFPKIFAKENAHQSPSFSLIVSTILMQLFMIAVYFANNAWNVALSITGVMVLPVYVGSTLYLWKISISKKDTYPEKAMQPKWIAWITGCLGTVYGLWLVYSAGLDYVLLACIIYCFGIPVFYKARKESAPNEKAFEEAEIVGAVILAGFGILAIVLACCGMMNSVFS